MSAERSILFFFLLFFSFLSFSQEIVKSFAEKKTDSSYLACLKKECSRNKNIPSRYDLPILIALSYYPELKNTKIEFRIRKKSSPLMVRPSVAGAIFRSAKKRKYIVFISSSAARVDSVLMHNLPLDAQIGVIGHELAHVSFFLDQGRLRMLRVALGNFSRRYLDRIEFETDRSAIDHGLGYQLLCWSEFVRLKLKMERWRGMDEYINGKTRQPRTRYMNPETIKAVMEKHPLYAEAEMGN
jgi:predicted SprT family Zn-dependent metalloprotease